MAGGVNIYLYECASLLVTLCVVYLRVYVCETHSKVILVPRLDIYRSIISLSEKTHQMWHNHLFSQRNKTSKIAVGGGEGWRQQERGVGQNFKKWNRQSRGVFIT